MKNAKRYFVLFMQLSRFVAKERAGRAAALQKVKDEHHGVVAELKLKLEEMKSTNTRLDYELDQATHALRLANSSLKSADAETARVHTLNISLCRKLTELENSTVDPARLTAISNAQTHAARRIGG